MGEAYSLGMDMHANTNPWNDERLDQIKNKVAKALRARKAKLPMNRYPLAVDGRSRRPEVCAAAS